MVSSNRSPPGGGGGIDMQCMVAKHLWVQYLGVSHAHGNVGLVEQAVASPGRVIEDQLVAQQPRGGFCERVDEHDVRHEPVLVEAELDEQCAGRVAVDEAAPLGLEDAVLAAAAAAGAAGLFVLAQLEDVLPNLQELLHRYVPLSVGVNFPKSLPQNILLQSCRGLGPRALLENGSQKRLRRGREASLGRRSRIP